MPAEQPPQNAVQQAEKALLEGRFADAEKYSRTHLASHPRDVPASLLLARALGRSGRRPEAIQLLRQLPISFDSLTWLGTLLREDAQAAEAATMFQKAIDLDPKNPSAYFGLGMSHLVQADYTQAAPSFEKAIALRPNFANYHFHLALAYEYLGREKAAVDHYQKAIAISPPAPPAFGRLGSLLLKLSKRTGDRGEALTLLKRAVEIQPSPANLVQLSNGYFAERDLDSAEAALKRVLTLDQNYATAHEGLGAILQERGKFDEAAEQYEKSIALGNPSGSAFYSLLRSRKITLADRPLLDKMATLAADPTRPEDDRRDLRYALGKAYDDLGDYEAAMQNYDEANRLAGQIQFATWPFDKGEYAERVRWGMRVIDREFMADNEAYGSDSELPVFIVGMIRSGTTLVEQILSTHPQIAEAGELRFWLLEGGKAMDSTGKKLDPVGAGRVERDFLKLLKQRDPQAQRVTDKMPTNYMALGLMSVLFPKAKIIHCRRNPVDNCLSIYTTPFAGPPHFAHNRENIVFGYKLYLEMMEHWREVLPAGRMLEVDYEQLVADREGVTRQMVEFVGLDWNDACLHHEKNERVVATPSLWQVRQPIYTSSVERWRRYEPWLGAFRTLLR
jgi:tetratricopeptide (TPR) repeat protein